MLRMSSLASICDLTARQPVRFLTISDIVFTGPWGGGVVCGPVCEVLRGPGPLGWSTDWGSAFLDHPSWSAILDFWICPKPQKKKTVQNQLRVVKTNNNIIK